MKQIKKTQFRDNQILIAISKLKRCTILDLFHYCITEYNRFSWDYYTIRNSITRLYNKNEIIIELSKEDIDYNYNGKVYKQGRTIKYYIINGDKNEL